MPVQVQAVRATQSQPQSNVQLQVLRTPKRQYVQSRRHPKSPFANGPPLNSPPVLPGETDTIIAKLKESVQRLEQRAAQDDILEQHIRKMEERYEALTARFQHLLPVSPQPQLQPLDEEIVERSDDEVTDVPDEVIPPVRNNTEERKQIKIYSKLRIT